jgi:hypothetical protein
MHSRKGLKLALCVTLSLLAAVVTYSAAIAWTWAFHVTVSQTAGLCVQGDAGIDHFVIGSPGSNTLAYSEAYALDQGCGNGLAGRYAATRLDVHYWTGSQVVVCTGTDWTFGYTGFSSFGTPSGPALAFSYDGFTPRCSSGWYSTSAGAFVWDGSAWRGGGVWSGWEYVPYQSSLVDTSKPPQRPDWVDADGKINIDKAPKEMPAAGPDGKPIREASGGEKKVPTYFGAPPPPLRADLFRGPGR